MKESEGDVHADLRGRRIRISTPFPFTAELSTNSPGNLVVFWNYDIQTVFHAVELSTNSLRAFVACWNYDLYTFSMWRLSGVEFTVSILELA